MFGSASGQSPVASWGVMPFIVAASGTQGYRRSDGAYTPPAIRSGVSAQPGRLW